MNLHINSRGSWKDLCQFEPQQLRQVKEAVVVLAQALAVGGRTDGGSIFRQSWRITGTVSRSPKVIAWLDPKNGLKWRNA